MGVVPLLITETMEGATGATQEISLLGLIVPLFSGFVGGLVVLYIQNHLRNKKEEKERDQELKGLLRVLDAEMARNEELLHKAVAVDLSPSGGDRTPIIALRDLELADWDRTKVRLARLTDGEHFTALDKYYRKVRETSEKAASATVPGNYPQVQSLARECKAASDEARPTSRKLLQG